MGKRELLIVSAFVVAGIVAYQVASPEPVNRRQGFSFSSFVSSLRREVRANRSTASVTTTGTIPLGDGVSEVRLSGFPRLTLTGGTGPDVSYELVVESNGADEAGARQNASGTTLAQDVVGPSLSLRPVVPRNVRSVARLSLTVPKRLLVRITNSQGGARIDMSDVAGVHLDGVVGDVRLARIQSEVTGNHRNGAIDLSGAGAVTLTLISSRVTIEDVAGAVTLNARNGPARITAARGPIALDVTNGEVTVAAPHATVRVSGTGGKVAIDDPQKAVNIDMRRTDVSVTLRHAVPVTAITADAPLRLLLDGPPALALDAVAVEGGTIDATDFLLTPENSGDESRVRHQFGAGTAAVALRNQRAAIVISRTK